MKEAFPAEKTDRLRPEGGNCLGPSQETQDPKVGGTDFGEGGGHEGTGWGWLPGDQTPSSAHGAKKLGLVLRCQGATGAFPAGETPVRWGCKDPSWEPHTFSLHPCSLQCGAGSPGAFHSTHFHALPTVLQALSPGWGRGRGEDAKTSKTGFSHHFGIIQPEIRPMSGHKAVLQEMCTIHHPTGQPAKPLCIL